MSYLTYANVLIDIDLCIFYTLLLSGCGSAGLSSVSPTAYTTLLDNLSQAIASNAGYSQCGIELTDNPIRLQIAISGVNLAQADESTRNPSYPP